MVTEKFKNFTSLTITMAIIPAYKNIFIEMVEKYVKNKLKRDYEPNPAKEAIL